MRPSASLPALAAACAGASAPNSSSSVLGGCTLDTGADCYGDDISNAPGATPEDCCTQCSGVAGCAAFTHAPFDSSGGSTPTCFLKTGCSDRRTKSGCTAGTVAAAPTPPPSPGSLCDERPGNCDQNDIRNAGVVSSAAACCALCEGEAGCAAWTWNRDYGGDCYLKKNCDGYKSDSGTVCGSGPPAPTPPPAPPTPSPPAGSCGSQSGTDYDCCNMGDVSCSTATCCCDACAARAGCVVGVWDSRSGNNKCYLKSGTAGASSADGRTALFPGGVPPPPTLAPPPAPIQPLTWDAAYSMAESTLAQLTASEKYTLMKGVGWPGPNKWWYIGNIPAIPRLGIPSLNMQDAAGGFRTNQQEYVGTVTCWPSLLAMAATWDVDAMREFAVALGTEFSIKGSNLILGPSINVHRVARNGRNFEYLSGEDPYLGAKLTEQYVLGVQSMGVATCMKHYAFNQQETNRNSVSATVDAKTRWELYYPPYQAAVDAGAVSAMCSYNKVDGTYACSNEQLLKEDLKQGMGFRGFVMSDWNAGHATTVDQGLDMDMPMGGTNVFSPGELSSHNVDDAVKRILAGMYLLRLPDNTKCTPPGCEATLRRDATAGHAAVARAAATESVVLLRNDGVLPLSSSVKTVAVIGSAADAKAYNPNSGQPPPPPPAAAALLANASAAARLRADVGNWDTGDYYAGGGSGHVAAAHPVSPLAGIKSRAAAAGVAVIESATDDKGAAESAAAQADVAIVVAGTTCGESTDRGSLNLDHDANGLIAAVAARAKKTVVLMMIPGTILTPWRDSVSAAAVLFLGGQETGTAFAAVVFGDHSPTGRLPIALPATEADTIAPSGGSTAPYSEGLATSYRNKNFNWAFAFGHGLTYADFTYGAPAQQSGAGGCAARVAVTVTHGAGGRAAREVAQLYLEFPPAAGQPAPVLKGFQKTQLLQPGGSEKVTFCLTQRDLSYYDSGAWVQVHSATAHIGRSSADIRQSLSISV